MSISELVESYSRFSEELSLAIESDQKAEIRRIDSKLEEIFGSIISLEPESRDIAAQQAGFLLNFLSPVQQRSAVQQQVCERLLRLIA